MKVEKVEMTNNEYQEFLKKNASRLYNEPGYTLEDYNRDADSVIIKGFELDKFHLSDEKKAFINKRFSLERESRMGNLLLECATLTASPYNGVYPIAKALECENVKDEGLRGFFKNDEDRLVLEFCEGDIYLCVCETDLDYKRELDSYCKFYNIPPIQIEVQKDKSYFDVHITYGPGDGDGYSVYVEFDGIAGEQDAIDKVRDEHLYQEPEDLNNIDYIEEIDEKTYLECTGKETSKEYKFTDLLPGKIGEKLDDHFEKQGWKLLEINGDGFQVYFGKGVQVDNNFEYGFPHLYDKEMLKGWAKDFHDTILPEKKSSLNDKIKNAQSNIESVVNEKDTKDLGR